MLHDPTLRQGRELASLSAGDSCSRLVSPLRPARGNAEARTRSCPAPAALFASLRTRRKSARRSASALAPPWERPRLRSRWVTARKAQRNTSTAHQPTASKSRKRSSWPSEHGPAEIRETSAFLQIGIGNNVATRAEDDWSQSVHNRVRLSVYPLAVWLASSWWRLRWEPAPYSGVASVGWWMAHELAAAGNGSL